MTGMLQAAAWMAGIAAVLGALWTAWDVFGDRVTPQVRYAWWWLRDRLGFVEEEQPPSLAGLTIVKQPLKPRVKPQSLNELDRPVPALPTAGSDLLGLKADVS